MVISLDFAAWVSLTARDLGGKLSKSVDPHGEREHLQGVRSSGLHDTHGATAGQLAHRLRDIEVYLVCSNSQ
jgi:hypothetical protein